VGPLTVALGVLFESSIDFAPVEMIPIEPEHHLTNLFGVDVTKVAIPQGVYQVIF
jgi:hypothetical protein